MSKNPLHTLTDEDIWDYIDFDLGDEYHQRVDSIRVFWTDLIIDHIINSFLVATQTKGIIESYVETEKLFQELERERVRVRNHSLSKVTYQSHWVQAPIRALEVPKKRIHRTQHRG